VTTDVAGIYRVPDLPPGAYAVAVYHASFGAIQKRTGLRLRAGLATRVDVSLVRSREVLEIRVLAPTIDVGSSATGLSVDGETARRVPIAAPTSKGGANRSFEAIAEASPGARNDTYGTSFAGATSPENRYAIDGLDVNDPSVGLNGTPLSVEFVEEVRVEAGGILPEHGRTTGGNVQVITRSGSNEFHGGVYVYYTPGPLEGRRAVPRAEGQTVRTERNLGWIGDAGFDVGGRIIKDRLWFYGGVNVAHSAYNLDSAWHRVIVDSMGNSATDKTGAVVTERIAGTTSHDRARATSVQVLAKLTYSPTRRHTLELLGIHAPQVSGGHDAYGIDARLGVPEVGHIAGDYTALARERRDSATDLIIKWNARPDDARWSFDTLLGWHHQRNSALPVDGSQVGSADGLAGAPNVLYRRTDQVGADADMNGIPDVEVHAITDFRPLPYDAPAGACNPTPYTRVNPDTLVTERRSVVCPVANWNRLGPGFIYDRRFDRGQFRHVVTRTARGAGHHIIKFGVDVEYVHSANHRAYTGERIFRENPAGTAFAEYRQFGDLRGPDEPEVLRSLNTKVAATTIGGFIQDSWLIMDRVTLNAGVRYDAQYTFAGDRSLAMVLPNQISPRAGLVWDPTRTGRGKLFVHYARYYQNITLSLVDLSTAGEPLLHSSYRAPPCDPTTESGCDDASRRDLTPRHPSAPDQKWSRIGSGPVPIDPKIRPPSTDEIVAGGEFEVVAHTRLGVQYTHRRLHRMIEDMSRDEANTYFLGNPGYGIAADLPRAVRNYDAATVFVDRRFARRWLFTGSYTLSWLRGNVSGLFRPETTQLSPNMNSDFDTAWLRVNREGDLPGDARHSFKVFAAGEIALTARHAILLGGAARARSGGPTNYLGQHSYGHSEVFLLPRGSGDRLPWIFSFDPSIGYTQRLTGDVALTITLDVFNALNFQQVIAIDERYTPDIIEPITGGTRDDLRSLVNSDGLPFTRNPNFGKPTAYQFPRQLRFGVRLTF
jgi:hypothetical protein